MSSKSRYDKLKSDRMVVLQRAQKCSELTIPALLPPDGHTQGSSLPTPYQSLGARGVNNIASKMLLALLPANNSFFRLSVPDDVLEELGAERTQAEAQLSVIERRVSKKIEALSLRVVMFEGLKHLAVTGNGLVYLPQKGGARFFPLSQYAVMRDGSGTVIEIVVEEKVHPDTLDPAIRAACGVKPNGENDVAIYTHIKLDNGKHVWHQELNDTEVPNTKGSAPVEESPWIVLRWQAVANEDYGRGLVEEYLGDLISLEELSKAITTFSAIAAKIIILLHPNAQTDEDDLKEAESGDVVLGSIQDIDVLQLEKYADFQVAKSQIDDLTQRLSHAFLLTTGTVRQAERVTAEEIRLHAQELEDVLGGVYTVQSQELQLPLVRRVMSLMQRSGEIPKLPKVVTPTITTGFEALGRGHDLNRLRGFLQDVFNTIGPEAVQYLDKLKLLQQLATGHGIDMKDAILSQEQVAQNQQAAMASQAMADSAPGVAQTMAKAAMEQ